MAERAGAVQRQQATAGSQSTRAAVEQPLSLEIHATRCAVAALSANDCCDLGVDLVGVLPVPHKMCTELSHGVALQRLPGFPFDDEPGR